MHVADQEAKHFSSHIFTISLVLFLRVFFATRIVHNNTIVIMKEINLIL